MSKIKVDEIIGGISTTSTIITFLDGVTIPSNKSFILTGELSTIGIATGKLIGDGSALTGLPISTLRKIAGLSVLGVL